MKKVINISLYKNRRLELESKELVAFYSDNKYTFFIDNIKTILSDTVLIRENDEYLFKLDIIGKKCTYLLKPNNVTFDIDVEKISYEKEKNEIRLIYKITSDEEVIELVLEEIGEINE